MELIVTFGRWEVFLLVLARVAAVVGTAPLFSTRAIPTQVKVGFAVTLTVLLAPVQAANPDMAEGWIPLVLNVLGEVVVGLLMGFSGMLVFSAVQVASRLVGVQIGLGMPSTMDPLWPESGSFLETFYGMLALVVFLSIGGHHLVISALARSFDVVPVGSYSLQAATADHLLAVSAAMFSTALHLAIAAVATMLLSDMAMGLVVRTMPQMNIFSVGMSIKTGVGLFVLFAVIPWTMVGFADLGRGVGQAMVAVLP